MKKIISCVLALCLLFSSLFALAEGCGICNGNGMCNTCDGKGYTSFLGIHFSCRADCDGGRCPVHTAGVINSADALVSACSVCGGRGYQDVTMYGSNEPVRINCTACGGASSAAAVPSTVPSAVPNPSVPSAAGFHLEPPALRSNSYRAPVLGNDGLYLMAPEEFVSGPVLTKYEEDIFEAKYIYDNHGEDASAFGRYVDALVASGYYAIAEEEHDQYSDEWHLAYTGPRDIDTTLGGWAIKVERTLGLVMVFYSTDMFIHNQNEMRSRFYLDPQPLIYEKDYVSATPSITESENAFNLFDGDASTKWCVRNQVGYDHYAHVIWDAGDEISVTGYTMVTGNDNNQYNGRNPQTWLLYGSNTWTNDPESSTWTLIHYVVDDRQMQDRNQHAYQYTLEQTPPAFRYYLLVIVDNEGSVCMQLSEFMLDYAGNTATISRLDNPETISGGGSIGGGSIGGGSTGHWETVTVEKDCPSCTFGNCSVCGGDGWYERYGQDVPCDPDCSSCDGEGSYTTTEQVWVS